MKDIKKLTVCYNDKIVGYLAEISNDKFAFQYDDEWIVNGFAISPFSLPLDNKIFISNSPYFEGLFGVFYDSLPDGWGNLIISRALAKKGVNYEKLSPLTKLSLINKNGLGGLSYLPTQGKNSKTALIDLDYYSQIVKDLLNDKYTDLDNLYLYGGSSGGARPKCHLDNWIIKFPLSTDDKNVGKIEYDANSLAKKAGINTAIFKLFPSKATSGYFGSYRFDRLNEKRVHVISLAGALETTHRIPNMDYIHLFKVVEKICINKDELYEVFRRMTFNVLYGNKDDHSKNFSFIYDEELKSYKLSPAYDITKTPNKYEHEMTVNGNGSPTITDLLQVAKTMKLSLEKCKIIINDIEKVIK